MSSHHEDVGKGGEKLSDMPTILGDQIKAFAEGTIRRGKLYPRSYDPDAFITFKCSPLNAIPAVIIHNVKITFWMLLERDPDEFLAVRVVRGWDRLDSHRLGWLRIL